jgi:hypothetical protein
LAFAGPFVAGRRYGSMKQESKRDEIADPKPKAPYQRPDLRRVGTLRDVTAGLPSGGN